MSFELSVCHLSKGKEARIVQSWAINCCANTSFWVEDCSVYINALILSAVVQGWFVQLVRYLFVLIFESVCVCSIS